MNRYFKWFLLILVLIDTAYTFTQNYYTMATEGDIATVVMVSDGYKEVMSDPLALDVVFKGESYPATNRFFAHWTMMTIMKPLPQFFQLFTDPVSSIYVTFAFCRTLIQLVILYLLCVYISGSFSLLNSRFLIAAVLLSPVFQVAGYSNYIGITYNSITYTFFYGFPFIPLLIFFLPFGLEFFHGRKINFGIPVHILMVICMFFIAFGGPLGPPVMCIVCSAALLMLFVKGLNKSSDQTVSEKIKSGVKNIPLRILFYFSGIILLSLYSYYVGKFNTENLWSELPLGERYARLPEGFYVTVLEKLGIPMLIIISVLNIILLRNIKTTTAARIITFSKYLGILSLVYLLLLPFGGSRGYRPLIIRSDTFSPVTLSLMLMYGVSTVYLLSHFAGRSLKMYLIPVIACIIIYTNADRINFEGNKCDRAALEEFVQSDERIVKLSNPYCTPFSWGPIADPQNSHLNVALLRHWKVVEGDRYYYN